MPTHSSPGGGPATGLDDVEGGIPEAAVIKARTAHWAVVDRMDGIIGTLQTTLDQLGKTEDTP